MPKNLIIVDSRRDWQDDDSDIPITTAIDYLRRKHHSEDRRTRVINLCRNLEYGGVGYYCSLLGEARSHHVLPDVRTLLEVRRQSLYRPGLADLQPLLEKATEHLQKGAGATYRFRIFFGWTTEEPMRELARDSSSDCPCRRWRCSFGPMGSGASNGFARYPSETWTPWKKRIFMPPFSTISPAVGASRSLPSARAI
jgi:hypothetical protein